LPTAATIRAGQAVSNQHRQAGVSVEGFAEPGRLVDAPGGRRRRRRRVPFQVVRAPAHDRSQLVAPRPPPSVPATRARWRCGALDRHEMALGGSLTAPADATSLLPDRREEGRRSRGSWQSRMREGPWCARQIGREGDPSAIFAGAVIFPISRSFQGWTKRMQPAPASGHRRRLPRARQPWRRPAQAEKAGMHRAGLSGRRRATERWQPRRGPCPGRTVRHHTGRVRILRRARPSSSVARRGVPTCGMSTARR
jgi:hypothetical protein